MSSAGRHIEKNKAAWLGQLQELLAIPSISTEPSHAGDVQRGSKWVRDRLESAGCSRVRVHKTARHPIVYGEWLGAPGAPTILVYGHYDVQPVDPLDLWTTPPFEPTVKDGKIYARGASDDKGQFLTHVCAFESHLEATGSCPVNIKFLIEGEEEIGSPSLMEFLKQNRKTLACDAVVVSDTAMIAKGRPAICYGLRGMTYLQIELRGTSRDLHSGVYGGAVVNPANALVQMLGALKNGRGRVSVPGFYDDVRRPRPSERREFARLPYSDAAYRKSIGAPALHGEPGFTTFERVWTRPSLDVNGIWSGFTGEGAKTVIPAEAKAKISMRLVPDQKPADIARKVTAFLKKLAPKSVSMRVHSLHDAQPWITPPDGEPLRAAAIALKRAFGKPPCFVREGGSIPVVPALERALRAPVVLMGLGLADDNLHAPNEKFDLDNFHRGMLASAYMMEEIGRGDD